MNASALPSLAILVLAALLGAAPRLCAQSVTLKQCPEPVAATIVSHLGQGRADKIKLIRIENRVLYLVKIKMPGRSDRKLHISGDGTLLKIVDEIRHEDLPEAVRNALAPFLAGKGRFDEAERITVDGRVEYHVEVDLPAGVDLHLFFSEAGELLRRFDNNF